MQASDCLRTTEEYFARWLGTEAEELRQPGIRGFYSAERETSQPGYPHPFDGYLLRRGGTLLFSCSRRAEEKVPGFLKGVSAVDAPEQIGELLEGIFGVKPSHNLKFVWQEGMAVDIGEARQLSEEDYPAFLEFFRAGRPNCVHTEWLEEYFMEIAGKGFSFAVFREGKIACATDAPVMPYLEGAIQEIGVRTLSEHQRKGYAAQACAAAAAEMLRRGVCPAWSTGAGNHASEQLAYRVGFAKFADVWTFRLENP